MADNKDKEFLKENSKNRQAEENQRLKDQSRIPDEQNRMKSTENQFR
ncbi:hypothetical protein [Pueribacillus theae]|nr:hypothetical protein [Pueribacillus theae]